MVYDSVSTGGFKSNFMHVETISIFFWDNYPDEFWLLMCFYLGFYQISLMFFIFNFSFIILLSLDISKDGKIIWLGFQVVKTWD